MAKTPHLDSLIKRSKIEKRKKAISKVYFYLSTLLVVVTLIMISLKPDRYLNMVAVLLLATIALIAIQNMQLHKLKKPQAL